MPSIATFNANNFFLRYHFDRSYPGGEQNTTALIEAAEVATIGYLPERRFGQYAANRYIVWDPQRRQLAFDALLAPDNRLPDILCLQEVENVDAIRILNQRYFNGHYQYSFLVDGYDPRNIDVGLLSVFPLKSVRTHLEDEHAGGTRLFQSRDCLEVDIELHGEDLTLYINHLKSKFVNERDKPTKAELKRRRLAGHQKRLAQSQEIANLIDKRFRGRHASALYAVVGDLNDTPESPWLAPLTQSQRLTNVLFEHRGPTDHWTYYWRAKGRVSQIDYILASRALAAHIDAKAQASKRYVPHIERAGLAYRAMNAQGDTLPVQATLVQLEVDEATPPNAGATQNIKIPFRFERYESILDDWKNNISDHCPVKVWF